MNVINKTKAALALSLLIAAPAFAEDGPTYDSLLKDGSKVAIPQPAKKLAYARPKLPNHGKILEMQMRVREKNAKRKNVELEKHGEKEKVRPGRKNSRSAAKCLLGTLPTSPR